MSKLVGGFLAASVVVALCAVPANAVLTNEQAKCQDTAAKQGRVYLKKAFKARQKCEDGVNKGTLPEGTDCALQADAAAKVSAAALKYSGKVTDKCPDLVVQSLSFGEDCRGVTTGSDLATCLIAAHDAAVDALIETAYPASPAKRCDSGTNPGAACTSNANCTGGGTCVLPGRACDGGDNDGTVCAAASDCSGGGLCLPSKDQAKCAKTLGKTLIKQANKRLSLLQKCKKSVASGKLLDDGTTDCVVESSAKLTQLMTKSVEKIEKKCTDAVAATDLFGGSCAGADESASVAACGLCAANAQSDTLITVAHGTVAVAGTASVAQVANLSECVGGPMSRCAVGDYVLANDKIRVVVQDIQRNYLGGIGQFGGQIIDGDLVRTGLDPDRDNFEEWAVSLNIESTAHYTALQIINDGSDGGPAVLRATGVDDLIDLLNPSSTIADFGFLLSTVGADDRDIPVAVMTDYILEPGTSYVRVETTVQNTDNANDLDIYFGEFINGSGEVEFFQPGYGFGEPLVASPCKSTATKCNQNNDILAYTGENGADGVSYGYVHEVKGSSTFTTSGVSVPQLGVDVLQALLTLAGPNQHFTAMGNPGDSKTFTRYFLVGNGSVSSLTDIRNSLKCLAVGTLKGTATADGNPLKGIDIAILGDVADGPGNVTFQPLLQRNVVTHTRTDANGDYLLTLPAGNYSVVANLEGSPYEGGASSPPEHAVAITAFGTTTQNIALPATGGLRVLAVDENANPIAAKFSVVGFDPSPDPRNAQTILVIKNNTGVFGEKVEDGFPFGVSYADFVDASGDSGVLPLEPGSYRVVVSHGPEYSIYNDDVTVTAGATTTVNAVVEHVVDTTGFASGDFHVHSIDSPDAQVSRARRVISMLGEGVDFFATTDHGYRADFSSTIAALGVGSLISTTVGQEITTFDYGHFNAWPLDWDPNLPDHGFVDHGGAAPDGFDYPSAGNYSETPATIVSLAHGAYSGGPNTVQINHIHSHFGVDGGSGLAIDTANTPPTSGVPAASRRLNPLVTNYFTDTFDALEIWIGDDRGQVVTNFLGQNAGDWFNLINQGIVSTGIADSDTHRRFITQAGFPRNQVANLEDDQPGSLDQDDMSERVNEGRVVGTNGPMIRLTAYASSTGESGGLDLGRCTGVVPCTSVADCPPCRQDGDCGVGEACTELPTTISTSDNNVSLTIDVQSPEWAEFDRIDLYVNTTTTRHTTPMVQTGAPGGAISVNRYSLNPDITLNAPMNFTVSTQAAPGTSSNRLVASVTVPLNGLSGDTWVVVMVSGSDGVSKPLFPVVPNSIFKKACSAHPCESCTTNANCPDVGFGETCDDVNTSLSDLTDGNLGQCGMMAYAFTNPIFIDVDGGGWSAPGVSVTP